MIGAHMLIFWMFLIPWSFLSNQVLEWKLLLASSNSSVCLDYSYCCQNTIRGQLPSGEVIISPSSHQKSLSQTRQFRGQHRHLEGKKGTQLLQEILVLQPPEHQRVGPGHMGFPSRSWGGRGWEGPGMYGPKTEERVAADVAISALQDSLSLMVHSELSLKVHQWCYHKGICSSTSKFSPNASSPPGQFQKGWKLREAPWM